MSNPSTLQVVTTDVGRGPCPIPYPRKSTPRARTRVPESDTHLGILRSFQVQDLRPRRTRFEGFQVVDQLIDYAFDIHGGWYGCFRLLLAGQLIFAETIGEVVREQGPFRKLRVILVEN
jgi:hypothetical protein